MYSHNLCWIHRTYSKLSAQIPGTIVFYWAQAQFGVVNLRTGYARGSSLDPMDRIDKVLLYKKIANPAPPVPCFVLLARLKASSHPLPPISIVERHFEHMH